MLIGQNFNRYLAEETISIDLVSTQKPEEPNPRLQVIPQNRESFLQGFELYRRRPDKEYSLTDCISMTVMQRLKISQVLTHDNHFQQEGFIILFE
jgi:predicted nucleic acid-binding protein